MVGHVSVFSDLAETQAPQLGSEADLHKRDVVDGETQDTLDGLPNHLVELNSLILPQVEGRCPHEVDRAHNAVAHAK